MKVCVIGGAGYVGLVTGLGLADLGHRVVNVDIDEARIARLRQGDSPIHEEGIGPVLERNLEAGRIRFTQELSDSLADSEVVFIAVGTPSQGDGQADLSAVIEVAENLLRCWNLPERPQERRGPHERYRVVAVKSTVPVGAIDLVRGILCRELREGVDFDLVSNPEFLREGQGLHDFFHPDRIVVGACSDRATQTMRALYAAIIGGPAAASGETDAEHGQATGPAVPFVETDLASAQMIKYASNAFLAARISFINEIAWLCERLGADVKEVAGGMGLDPRIGHAYLEAGLGFGGPCLEKDLKSLIQIAEANGYEPQFLRSVLDRNERQVEEVVAKLKQMIGSLLYQRTIAVFGLAFKPNTNDIRNSASLKVIRRLKQEGATIKAHDPMVSPGAPLAHSESMGSDASASIDAIDTIFDDPYEAADGADAVLILTDWPQYAELDYTRIRDHMVNPCIFDARNLLDSKALGDLGYQYAGIGVAAVSSR